MQGTDWKFKENSDAKQALIYARRTQDEVIELCKQLSSDRLEDEKKLAAEISFKLGKYYEDRDGNLNDAMSCFNDTLQRTADHLPAMVSIARIHQTQGSNEQCF